MKVLVADDHRLMVRDQARPRGRRGHRDRGRGVHGEPGASAGSPHAPGRRPPRHAHAGDGRLDVPRPAPEGLPEGQGDRALGLQRPGADPGVPSSHGASGYIVKSVNPIDLPSAIRQAVEGTVFHAARPPRGRRADRGKAAGLTERELAILKARRAWAFERGDRQGALGHRADGEVPPDEHLPEAESREPHRGRPLRVPARPGREPALRAGLMAPPERRGPGPNSPKDLLVLTRPLVLLERPRFMVH